MFKKTHCKILDAQNFRCRCSLKQLCWSLLSIKLQAFSPAYMKSWTQTLMWDPVLPSCFFFSFTYIRDYTIYRREIFKQFMFIDSHPSGFSVSRKPQPKVPPQGPSPGSHHRVLPQGPTLWFHPRMPPQGPPYLRVPLQSPTLGSWVPLFQYANFYCISTISTAVTNVILYVF